MQLLKRGIGYCSLVIIYGFILIKGLNFQLYLQEQTAINYNPWPTLIFTSVFPIIIGIIFALPTAIKSLRGNGTVQVDWILFCIVGLPTLFVAFIPAMFFTPLGKYIPQEIMFKNANQLFFLSGVVSGYSMVKSIKRQKLGPKWEQPQSFFQ